MDKINNKKLKVRMLKEIDDFFNGVVECDSPNLKLTTSSFSNKFIKNKKN
jgi:hypothetical protein